MQFIENTRSRSSLIEFFRHFFIDTSIFERQGGTPLEGEGKAASSRPARYGRASGRQAAARQKKSPTLTKRAWAPGKASHRNSRSLTPFAKIGRPGSGWQP